MRYWFNLAERKIAIGAAVVIVGLLAFIFLRTKISPPPSSNSNTVNEAAVADLVATSAEIQNKYQAQRADMANQLLPLMDKALSVADIGNLTELRDQLVDLAVPRDNQSNHLSLVLKLSLLIDSLSPNKMRIAGGGLPTVTQIQAQIKQLLALKPSS
ncbi:MAG: hypothetical protein WC621_04590 [Patescibacteria group bacterium]